jgi:probable HAF family extracellular repeat protein
MRTYTTLDDPLATFGTYTVAAGINDNSQIVGAFDDNGSVQGFLYSNGHYTNGNPPGSNDTNRQLKIS